MKYLFHDSRGNSFPENLEATPLPLVYIDSLDFTEILFIRNPLPTGISDVFLQGQMDSLLESRTPLLENLLFSQKSLANPFVLVKISYTFLKSEMPLGQMQIV